MAFDKLKVMNKMGEAAHKKSRAAEPEAFDGKESAEIPAKKEKKKPAAKPNPFFKKK